MLLPFDTNLFLDHGEAFHIQFLCAREQDAELVLHTPETAMGDGKKGDESSSHLSNSCTIIAILCETQITDFGLLAQPQRCLKMKFISHPPHCSSQLFRIKVNAEGKWHPHVYIAIAYARQNEDPIKKDGHRHNFSKMIAGLGQLFMGNESYYELCTQKVFVTLHTFTTIV